MMNNYHAFIDALARPIRESGVFGPSLEAAWQDVVLSGGRARRYGTGAARGRTACNRSPPWQRIGRGCVSHDEAI